MGNNEKDLKELDNDINLDDTLDEAIDDNSLNEENTEANIEADNTIESDSSSEVISDDSSEDSIDYLEEAAPNSEDEALTEDNIEDEVIEDDALTEDNIEANIEADNTSDDLESNEEVINDEDSNIDSDEGDTSDDDSNESEDESEANDLDNETEDESNDDDKESNEEDQSNYALLLKIHDLNNQIDILKSRLDNFEKRFNTEDDAIINSANAVYKTADIEARKREGGRLGNVGLAITIIFFILGIVVVGAYAVLYTVVEAMIKAGSPEKDYEALMMAAKILRFASFGVLGFAGLGFLFCLLGIFISKRKGTAIAGVIIGLFSLAFMIVILFVPQVLQPIIDSISKTFS